MIVRCPFCDSKDLDHKKDHIVCKNCGMGFKNPTDKLTQESIMDDLYNRIRILKLMFPLDDNKTLTLRYSLHEHRTSKHPTDKEGNCQWCKVNWKKMPEEKFKELLGYEKSNWVD